MSGASVASSLREILDPIHTNGLLTATIVVLYYVLYQQAAVSRSAERRFFGFLGIGWLVNLSYLGWADYLQHQSSHSYQDIVGVWTLNFLAHSFFIAASVSVRFPELRKRVLAVTIGAANLVAVALFISLPPAFSGSVHLFVVLLCCLSAAAAAVAWLVVVRRHHRAIGVRVALSLVISLGMYSALQLVALTDSTAITHPWPFNVGALVKTIHLIGLIGLFRATFAEYGEIVSRYESQRQAAANVDAARVLLEQANHELNTPALELRLKLSALEDIPRETRNNLLELVERVAAPLGVFINKVSELRESDYQLRREVFNVNVVCEEAINHLKLAIKPRVKFYKQYSHGNLVFGSRTELFQVVRNLVKNAIEATADIQSPAITITTKSTDRADDQSRIVISVADNGPGVIDENYQKVFVRGFSTKTGQGRGHGLAISREIVSSLGGTLELKQSPSGGAEFVVTLPAAIED